MKGIQKGFTLVETMIGVAVFILFSLGVYGGIISATKLGQKSRLEILENAIMIKQMESIRNLPYQDIGTIDGNPSGILATSTTVTESGTDFLIIIAVKSIDDPADGSAPLDENPDDYRSISLSVECISCTSPTVSQMSSNVRPPETNALNVRTVDSNGNPVPGATVTINNLLLSSTTIGTTDSNGYFGLSNIATGTLVYNISVSKPGYSTDSTFYPSATNTSPVKLPVTIQHGSSVNITFAIDKLSSLNVSAFDESCNSIDNADFKLTGGKLVGFPDIYKYSKNKNLGTINNLEWDNYSVSASGTAYAIAGSQPDLPFYLAPGTSQNLILNLRNHTPGSNTLLVNVIDGGNGMPVGGATVKLWKMLIPTTTLNTTGGYVGQTDWSGGSGQQTFSDPTKFASGGSTFNINSPFGDLSLQPGQLDGSLDSSTFDLGSNAYTLKNIYVMPITQPSESQVLARIAVSTSPSGLTNFLGPDGTASTYYTPTNTAIWSGSKPYRYLRYRVYLNTPNTQYKPNISDIDITYSNGCQAPGHVYFDSLLQRSYLLEVSKPGYSTSIACVGVAGPSSITVTLQGPGGIATAPRCVTPNSNPIIASAASANPSPVNKTTTTLSVLGTDNDGEGNLIYTWNVASKPTGASNPTFSRNGNNAAKSTVATFYKAGDYTFYVTVRDADYQTVSSSVSVAVNQTASLVTVNPGSVTILPNQTRQFSASTADQFGAGMGSSVTWSKSGIGTINSSGLFTAPGNGGNSTVRATVAGGVYGSATVLVNSPPTIATGASASPSPITGTNTTLSVRGADDAGEGSLTYTWSVTSKPSGASNPTFSRNDSHAARDTVATFSKAGLYSFRVTVKDTASQTVTSNVSVTVNQTASRVGISPNFGSNYIFLKTGDTYQFNGWATDQFGSQYLGSDQGFSVTSDNRTLGGTIDAWGRYTAPNESSIGHVDQVFFYAGSLSASDKVYMSCGSTIKYTYCINVNTPQEQCPTATADTANINHQCWTKRGVGGFSMTVGGVPIYFPGTYTWADANQLDLSCNTKTCNVPNNNRGICPGGWHVATLSDINTLDNSLGISQSGMCRSPQSPLSVYFTNYLDTSIWVNGGLQQNAYEDVGLGGGWHGPSQYSKTQAITFYSNADRFCDFPTDKRTKQQVRCVYNGYAY